MSPWLFSIFFDRVIIQVNERESGREVKLRYGKVSLSGNEMQEVDGLQYLRVVISPIGGMGEEVSHRVLEGRKV